MWTPPRFPPPGQAGSLDDDRRRGDAGLRRSRMERFIADLVQGLDGGKIDRREFCKSVALAAAVYGAGDAAQAQVQRGFKIIGINHMSYVPGSRQGARLVRFGP